MGYWDGVTSGVGLLVGFTWRGRGLLGADIILVRTDIKVLLLELSSYLHFLLYSRV